MLLSRFLSFGLASGHFRKSWAMEQPHDEAALVEKANQEETTVIVGAGSLGLSTAYYLALAAKASGKPRKIIVLEVFNKTFAAASGQNTGSLHHLFPESEGPILEPLGRYSFNLWHESASKAEFRSKVGYRARNCFEISEGHGLWLDVLPEWFKYDPHWDAKQETPDNPWALVNPIAVGKWLTAECTNLGVDIRLNATVSSVALSAAGTITSVEVITDGMISTLPCTSLILAAGPWTPDLYHLLFPSSRINLEGVPIGGDWILFKDPFPTTDASNAMIILNNIVGEKLEFAGRADGTIWLTGRKDEGATLPKRGTQASPNETMIKELLGRADTFLRQPPGEQHKRNGTDSDAAAAYHILSVGRGIRPGRRSILPIISEVPGSLLSPNNVDANPTNIFLNWGHGSYGITLGLGSGKIMSDLVNRRQPEIDIRPFALGNSSAS